MGSRRDNEGAASPASEEWSRWYETASARRRKHGSSVGRMLDRLDAQRSRQKLLIVGSGLFIAALIATFYVLLSG